MKLKLDENLGKLAFELLTSDGYDVCNVPIQKLQGADDDALIAKANDDARILVTLDLDFANPLRFPPPNSHGIAVLRLPNKISSDDLITVIKTLSAALHGGNINGHLWIIEKGRIRIHEND